MANPKTAIENPVKQFIPTGYEILIEKTGDLNLDSLPDKILVLDSIGERENYSQPPKRIMLLLFGIESGGFTRAFENSNALYTHDMGGAGGFEPLSDIKIDTGYFSIELAGGWGRFNWELNFMFLYDPPTGKFNLIKVHSYKTALQDTTLVEDQTELTLKEIGKVSFEEFSAVNYDL
ncbi:MAG: hypothetical protein GC181_10385 [Bacteroidetes bacterium]|nr:hypothetical protein [Bacteroidota bacterium]